MLNNIRCVLHIIWKTRNLTLIGKIQIIKSFALSKLIYVASIGLLPVPKYLIEKVESIIFNFIWNGKKKCNKKNHTYLSNGGGWTDMIDVESMFKALKVRWVQRLLNEENTRCEDFFKYYTKHFGKELILFSNYRLKDLIVYK